MQGAEDDPKELDLGGTERGILRGIALQPARMARAVLLGGSATKENQPMRGKLIRSLGLVAVVLLWTHAATAAPQEEKKAENEPFKKLTVDQVDKLLSQPGVYVYDGNRDQLYLDGHVPGAVHLFSKDIKEGSLPSDKNSTLIFYCHSER